MYTEDFTNYGKNLLTLSPIIPGAQDPGVNEGRRRGPSVTFFGGGPLIFICKDVSKNFTQKFHLRKAIAIN